MTSSHKSDVRPMTLAHFRATNAELSTLVSSYNNYCMNVVFGLLPQEVRNECVFR